MLQGGEDICDLIPQPLRGLCMPDSPGQRPAQGRGSYFPGPLGGGGGVLGEKPGACFAIKNPFPVVRKCMNHFGMNIS